jgi:hypothetical protein
MPWYWLDSDSDADEDEAVIDVADLRLRLPPLPTCMHAIEARCRKRLRLLWMCDSVLCCSLCRCTSPLDDLVVPLLRFLDYPGPP